MESPENREGSMVTRRTSTRLRLSRLLRSPRKAIPRAGVIVGSFATLLTICCVISERMPWQDAPREEPPPETAIDRLIRVRLIGASSRTPVRLQITSDYEILRGVNGPRLGSYPAGQPAAELRLTSSGIEHGLSPTGATDIVIKPSRDASLVINGSTYRGLLRVHVANGAMVLTNHVDIEAYLRGVLRGELPADFHPEAFRAQCVAARTYALYQKGLTPADRDWDVVDTEGSQMYIGVAGEARIAVDAVESTHGEICMWNDAGRDRIFCTYYSSACGGITVPVREFRPREEAVPPLAGRVVCDDCYLARFYRWDPVKLSKAEVTKRIVRRYPKVARLSTIAGLRAKELSEEGRFVRIQLDGSSGDNETLYGEDFRLSIGGHVVRSTWFTIETTPTHFVFRDGKGFGHGVGLCQYGMETKAQRGMSYRNILSAYYPHSIIRRLY